jgi:hypothetical protein
MMAFATAMGAKVTTLKAAADWLEQNLSTNDQVLALIQKCLHLQNSQGSQTQQIVAQQAQLEQKLQQIDAHLQHHGP